MYTSKFRQGCNNENLVSIAGKAPDWYNGRQYKKLAPKYWWWKIWEETRDNEYYIKMYYETVLDKLDPREVYNELGKDAILICYEDAGEFCHRRLVAEWLEKSLDITIKEIDT